jgi:hypothetical protein
MTGHNNALIAKVTVQSLLQQLQHAEILLTFGDGADSKLPMAIKDSLAKMRAQLNDLEFRLGAL